MNRIKYKDVEVLKREYQEIFNLQRFQKLQHMWSDVREELIGLGCDALVYPMLWPDILVADFKELAKIYFDYTRIAREIPASLKQSIANLSSKTSTNKIKKATNYMFAAFLKVYSIVLRGLSTELCQR